MPTELYYTQGIRDFQGEIGTKRPIVSINIYTYHVNQNSPVLRGQGNL